MPLATIKTISKEECLVTLDSFTTVWSFLLDLRNRKKSECLQSKFSDIAYRTCKQRNKIHLLKRHWTKTRCPTQYYRWTKPKSYCPQSLSCISCFIYGQNASFATPNYVCLNYPCGIIYVLTMFILCSQPYCISHKVLDMGLLWYITSERASKQM